MKVSFTGTQTPALVLFLCFGAMVGYGQSYTTSWIGNTNSGSKYNHISLDVDDICATADGTIYTNCRWDEDRREVSIIKNGALVSTVDWDAHAGGHSGGGAIAANTKYVFVGQGMAHENEDMNDNHLRKSPPKGQEWSIVRRYNHSGGQVPFATGSGHACSMLVLNEVPRKNGIIVEATGGATNHVAGLVATDKELYVSDRLLGKIRVYDASTMAPLREWNMARPGKLAVQSGFLWIIQEADALNAPKIVKYSSEGVLQPNVISFAPGAAPTGIAWDATTTLLIMADNGPDQNVKMYNTASLKGAPTIVAGTFGALGGIYSGTKGLAGPKRFNGLSGVASDSSGNIYVAQNGQGPLIDSPNGHDVGSGTVIEGYSAEGMRNWAVYGLEFVDCADADPASEKDVYTGDEHFTMDYSKPDGEQWTYKAYTIDRFAYPQDPRLNLGNVNRTAGISIRNFLNHKFMYLTDMNGHSLSIFRFDGEIAVPCGLWSPFGLGKKWQPNQPAGEWFWRDANGNGRFDTGEYEQKPGGEKGQEMFGRYIDAKGNIWMCAGSTLREFPVGSSLDEKGNPQYSFKTMQTYTLPANMNRLERVEYDANHDVMYLGGYLSTEKADTWGIFKRVSRINDWSKGNRSPVWTANPDYTYTGNNSSNVFPKAISIAGDYLFVSYFAPIKKHVSVFRLSDGAICATLKPGENIGKVTGDVDIPQGIRVCQRASGEYLIFQEDDARAKVVMYRWSPEADENSAKGSPATH